jgi:exopolyphosphatase / guanosine-5'-triphosphate,3'-diphosphate pyrophosphatase
LAERPPYVNPRLAVLDIGSNSCRLLIAELNRESGYTVLEEARAIVRLAPARPGGPIDRPAMERARMALTGFAALVKFYEPVDRAYLATAAVRGARNQDAVLKQFTKWLAHPVRVLSADEEAYYAVLAVSQSFPYLTGTVVDLGGGSAQIATYLGKNMSSSYSLPAGALSLHRRFLHGDPPRARELKALRGALQELFIGLPAALPRPVVLLGGTARALAELHQRTYGYTFPWPHGYELSARALARLSDRLAALSVSDRTKLPGMSPERADIILAGAIALTEFCSAANVKRVTISGEGVRQGVLYEELERRGLLNPNARSRTIAQLTAQLPGAPYDDRALAGGQSIVRAVGDVDLLVSTLLPVAITLHRVGDLISSQRSDRNAHFLLTSREMAGFTHRETMLLAWALASQRKPRMRRTDAVAPLKPEDFVLVEQLATILQLVVTLARASYGAFSFERESEWITVRGASPPFDALRLGARFEAAFGLGIRFGS